MDTRNLIACLTICACTCGAAAQQVTPEQQARINEIMGYPPGSTVIFEGTRVEDGGTLEIDEEATGEGAGLKAKGEKIVSEFNAGSPGSDLGKNRTATGGDTTSNSKTTGGENKWNNPFIWAAILCGLLACGAVYLRMFKVAAILACAGGCFAAAVVSPLLFAGAVIAGIAVLAGPTIWQEWKLRQAAQIAERNKAEAIKAETALTTVVRGVNEFGKAAKDPSNTTVPLEAYNRLKAAIEGQSNPLADEVIQVVKKANNLK